MDKPIYNKKGWVLGTCIECGKDNYVEPHGTDAKCTSHKCKGKYTEHDPIPYDKRDMSGTRKVKNPLSQFKGNWLNYNSRSFATKKELVAFVKAAMKPNKQVYYKRSDSGKVWTLYYDARTDLR